MTRWYGASVADESGQAMVLVAIFMLALLAVAGLVTDGGLVFAQRRDLQNVADAAAAAGAMQVDLTAYRDSNADVVRLDANAARDAAASYLVAEGIVEYDVNVSAAQVRVNVKQSAKTGFLRVLGIDEVNVAAAAVAEPRHGVTAEER